MDTNEKYNLRQQRGREVDLDGTKFRVRVVGMRESHQIRQRLQGGEERNEEETIDAILQIAQDIIIAEDGEHLDLDLSIDDFYLLLGVATGVDALQARKDSFRDK